MSELKSNLFICANYKNAWANWRDTLKMDYWISISWRCGIFACIIFIFIYFWIDSNFSINGKYGTYQQWHLLTLISSIDYSKLFATKIMKTKLCTHSLPIIICKIHMTFSYQTNIVFIKPHSNFIFLFSSDFNIIPFHWHDLPP